MEILEIMTVRDKKKLEMKTIRNYDPSEYQSVPAVYIKIWIIGDKSIFIWSLFQPVFILKSFYSETFLFRTVILLT